MEYVIFGFSKDVSKYSMLEILFYLLIYSILIGLVGKKAYGMRIHGQYSALVRYGRYSTWWYHVVIKVLISCLALIVLLFGIGAAVIIVQKGVYAPIEWFIAFILWLVGLCTVALIQAFIIQFGSTYKIMFAFLMCVEVVSLWLTSFPGSWIMYERSQLGVDDGFPITMMCVIQIVVIVSIVFCGHYIFKMRRRHGTGN